MRRWWVAVLALGACGRVGFDPVRDGVASDGADLTYADVVLADHPLAYWRLDDASATAADASGNGNDGAYMGSVTFGAVGALSLAANGGVPDRAVTFDGTTGYVSVGPRFAFSGTQVFSLEGWVHATQGAFYLAVCGRLDRTGGGSPMNGYALDMCLASGGLCPDGFDFFREVASISKDDTVQPSPSAWTHLVATYDGASERIYGNGTLAMTVASAGAIAAQTVEFRIADDGKGVALFAGTLDEVAVYGSVLADDRVAAHYAAGTR